MAIVTCHTETCSNADKPIELGLTWTDEEGLTQPIDSVSCGVCGQQITDVSDDERAGL